MKKRLIALTGISIIGISAGAYAFGPEKHCKNQSMHGEMKQFVFEKLLDLSDEQKIAIREIRQTNRDALKPSREQIKLEFMGLDPSSSDFQIQVESLAKAKAEQVEAHLIARAQVQAQIYEILTPEQREEFRSLREEMRTKMQSRRDKKGNRVEDI